jgi:hypothetical protein
MLFHAAAIEISVGPTRIAKRSQLGELSEATRVRYPFSFSYFFSNGLHTKLNRRYE